jgi:hypothetical protein
MPVKLFWLQNGNITLGTLNKNAHHFVVPRTLRNVKHTTPFFFVPIVPQARNSPASFDPIPLLYRPLCCWIGRSVVERDSTSSDGSPEKSRKVDLLTEQSIVKSIPSEPLKPFFRNYQKHVHMCC